MAKTKISEFDATAANNTDIDSINIAEGMAPSNVNNALRKMMSILKTEFFKTGTGNTSLGDTALDSLDGSSPGGSNVAIGSGALTANTTASNNTAVGYQAAYSNTTGSYNTALGQEALEANTTANYGTAVGYQALQDSTGTLNTAVGAFAAHNNTTGVENTVLGAVAFEDNTSGSYNTAIGRHSLANNTTADNNTAVGYQALYSTTGGSNTAIGYQAGQNITTGTSNTALGRRALHNTTTGSGNYGIGDAAGRDITTGSKNVVIGGYGGNQGGLDIRTSSNNIVLSDGDGNPKLYINSGTTYFFGTSSLPNASVQGFGVSGQTIYTSATSTSTRNHHIFYNGNGAVGTIKTSGSATSYNTSSDYRLKENVVDLTGATARLNQLAPKRFNFIADDTTTVDGFIAHEVQSIVPEAITGTHNEVDDDGNPVYQGIDQSKLVPLLVATIKELEARITALENA